MNTQYERLTEAREGIKVEAKIAASDDEEEEVNKKEKPAYASLPTPA